MLNKLLNWIDYHRGAWWAAARLEEGWSRQDMRTILNLDKSSQAFRNGALDALGGREMAR